jgi:hypothetical protein
MNNNIIIQDWAGNNLYRGNKDDPEVLRIMRKNKVPNDDIWVCWEDEEREENVYEYIYW